MGFRDWFGGSKRGKTTTDVAWLTGRARIAGLARKAEERAGDDRVLLLAHFAATLDALEAALGERSGVVRAGSESEVIDWLESSEGGAIGLALVSQLPEHGLGHVDPSSRPVSLLVAERHPQRSQDDRVERLAGSLPSTSPVQFHLALDDTLLERFGGERVKGLLEQLGMNEDEEISHPMLTSAVERAQAKIAERARSEIQARSADDWFKAIEPE